MVPRSRERGKAETAPSVWTVDEGGKYQKEFNWTFPDDFWISTDYRFPRSFSTTQILVELRRNQDALKSFFDRQLEAQKRGVIDAEFLFFAAQNYNRFLREIGMEEFAHPERGDEAECPSYWAGWGFGGTSITLVCDTETGLGDHRNRAKIMTAEKELANLATVGDIDTVFSVANSQFRTPEILKICKPKLIDFVSRFA